MSSSHNAPSVMPPATRSAVKRLRVKCKTGYMPTDQEMKMLTRAQRQWPDEYADIGHEALVETWPVGGRPPPEKAK